ncbi:CCR4-NOT transcription complex subunit 4 [Nymphaea thermarum]|nr:CCR4-NOT transcription complex subunit 4 [Nymphaea thermarum]
MTTMSEEAQEGERLCPLCTEEMDMTDQQLKPCKCGYEICVWCWNHIMDMAEKDESEGRCPACRTPYDKERIVGATVNCERLAEMNCDRRQKMQKSKTKASEGRKHLSNVRVIQRNLVYVVGIPPNLADEEVLERKEYFGQYGKVLKVSISRTSAGVPHTTNNTFSVYITYTKEEEAVRCIQAVNGFVLEGRPLRAHYGTTKYCHAWLKNMPCSNPECLYLHDVGTQEDSFTKDEVISPCIRTKIPQMPGASNQLQRRSGNVLPPPADELCNNGIPISGKVLPKTLASNPLNHITSPPNGNPGRSSALPAAASWGLRGANGKTASPNSIPSQGSGAHKQDLCNGSIISPPAVSSSACVSDEFATNLDSGSLRLTAKNNGRSATNVPREVPIDSAVATASSQVPSVAASVNIDSRGITASAEREDSFSLLLGRATDGASSFNVVPPSLCYASSSSSSNFHLGNGQVSGGKGYDTNFDKRPVLEDETSSDSTHINCKHEHDEPLAYQSSKEAAEMPERATGQKEMDCSRDWEVGTLADAARDKHLSPDNHLGAQHLESSEGLIRQQSSSPPTISEHNVSLCMQHNGAAGVGEGDWYSLAGKAVTDFHGLSGSFNHEHNFAPLSCTMSNSMGQDNLKNFCSPSDGCGLSSDHFDPGSKVEHARLLKGLESDIFSVDNNDYLAEPGESSIISNILSMNLDGADDPLTSVESITKLLSSESCKSLVKPTAVRKPINSNQSRFSFARQEEYAGQTGYSVPNRSHAQKSFIMADAGEVRDPSLLNQASIFPTNDRVFLPSNRTASRAPVSAPPGFVMPTRPPPPGFSSVERMDPPGFSSHDLMERAFNFTSSRSGSQQLDNGKMQSQYQIPVNMDAPASIDVELIDPAIMAVGKGKLPMEFHHSGLDLRSQCALQSGTFDIDPRIQLLMKRPSPATQNLGFSEPVGNGFSHLIDSLSNNLSMFVPTSYQQSIRGSHFGSGEQESWSGIQGNSGVSLLEAAESRRFGFDNHFPAYDDLRFRTPSSGDIYHRAFEK